MRSVLTGGKQIASADRETFLNILTKSLTGPASIPPTSRQSRDFFTAIPATSIKLPGFANG
jgi:hypothetical protein